ncbi:MAG: SLC13 family permease, partial [Pseudomonadota bacterium]
MSAYLTDQVILFALLTGVFGFLIWGRVRYDIVAFAALLLAVALGVVPEKEAFTGFGHPAVLIVALVLVVSRGLANSGAISLVAERIVDASRAISSHIAIMASTGAAMSALMNNVGALALLMPIDLHAAEQAKRSARATLMPLSFATILGGLVTLIGTPPNIIVASFREDRLGESFSMFDFSPVGLVCAITGVAFVALIGWRLIPNAGEKAPQKARDFKVANYLAELTIPEDAAEVIGKVVKELDDMAETHDVAIVGLLRGGRRLPGLGRQQEVRAGDVMLVEAQAKAISAFASAIDVNIDAAPEEQERRGLLSGASDLQLAEVVVPPGARIEGRTVASMRLLQRFGVTVVGLSRGGRRIRERVRKTPIAAGDVLLMLAPKERLGEMITWVGGLPLADRGLAVQDQRLAGIAVG